MKINYLNFNAMKTSKLFIAAIFCLTLITSCSDDDDNPAPVNPVELFTNVTLTFTNNADANDVVVLENIAPDGQGGTNNSTISGPFTSGATYSLGLAATDASDPNDVDDLLNDDVIPEADEHFFVYGLNNLNFTMTRDTDDVVGLDGNKIGVETTWVAGAASTGNLSITLVHEGTAVDEAANNNLGSATGGEEDFNITFTNVSIQ